MYRRYSLYKIGDSYTHTSYVYNDTNGSEASGGQDSSGFTWESENIIIPTPVDNIPFTQNAIYNFYTLVKS